jgi:hypothetical protein
MAQTDYQLAMTLGYIRRTSVFERNGVSGIGL